MRIYWYDQVSNEEHLRKSNQKPLMKVIQNIRLKWFGHVFPMEYARIARRLLEWNPRGTGKQCRPMKTWLDKINEDGSEDRHEDR